MRVERCSTIAAGRDRRIRAPKFLVSPRAVDVRTPYRILSRAIPIGEVDSRLGLSGSSLAQTTLRASAAPARMPCAPRWTRYERHADACLK